jgi:Sulfatase
MSGAFRAMVIMRSAPAGRWLGAGSLAPGMRYYVLASGFFLVVFCLVPFSLYAHSGESWGFPFFQLLWIPAIGVALYLASAVIIRLLAVIGNGTARAAACVLFCLGLFALFAHVYAPISIGPLDGSEPASDEPASYTGIEAALALALVLLMLQLLRGRGLVAASVFTVSLAIISLGYAGVLTAGDERDFPRAQAPTSGAREIDGNVYHIVLDSMRTAAFLEALKLTKLHDVFQGFELFENNISNYVTTTPSSASYLTGTRYTGGEYRKWVTQWKRSGTFATLSRAGYKAWMYAPSPNWDHRHVDRFWYNQDIYRLEGRVADVGLYDLIHVWLVSLAPNLLTNEILPFAAGLRDRIFKLVTGEARPFSVSELHPHAGVVMLRRLLREEELRAANGQYVYAHAALPHPPFVFDPDCHYVGPKKHRKEAQSNVYIEQAQCAVRLTAEFLRGLKRAGRYDAAIIIVHADTGFGAPRQGDATEDSDRTTLGHADGKLLQGISSLLMIKRPRANAPLRIVNTPTQLADLFPTILDLLDLRPLHQTHGRSVYSLSPEERRELRFGLDPAHKYRHDFVEVRIDDPAQLQESSLSVIGRATDPAVWRTGHPHAPRDGH